MKRKMRKAAPQSGFTLLEVLLVLVILIVLTSAVGVNVLNAQKRAMRNAAIAQMGLFKNMLTDYHMDMSSYPTTDQGLQSLTTPPDDNAKWSGPYAEKVPNDPWGNPYQYSCNADVYEVWSLGPDGQDGTADDVRMQ